MFAQEGYVESDCDDELLMSIPFRQAVKLQSIRIYAPEEHAPKTIKLFINKIGLGFDDMDSVPAAQELQLEAKDFGDKGIPLRFVKFQSVSHLTVWVNG